MSAAGSALASSLNSSAVERIVLRHVFIVDLQYLSSTVSEECGSSRGGRSYNCARSLLFSSDANVVLRQQLCLFSRLLPFRAWQVTPVEHMQSGQQLLYRAHFSPPIGVKSSALELRIFRCPLPACLKAVAKRHCSMAAAAANAAQVKSDFISGMV